MYFMHVCMHVCCCVSSSRGSLVDVSLKSWPLAGLFSRTPVEKDPKSSSRCAVLEFARASGKSERPMTSGRHVYDSFLFDSTRSQKILIRLDS